MSRGPSVLPARFLFIDAKVLLFLTVTISATALFGASYIVPPDEALIGKAEAIVIARATATWVEDTTEHGIETVTEFSVEDTLRGGVPHTFRIRMAGGHFGKRYKVIPGTPTFAIGEQVLLFVNKRAGSTDYTTTDFGLGRFSFQYDDFGRRLAVRDEGEIYGWDLKTHQPHREQRRAADKFIAYVRAISSGRPADPDYFVPTRPLLGQPHANGTSLRPVTQACSFPSTCTALQYTMSFYQYGVSPCNSGITANDISCAEAGPGGRWNTFPSVVNWNRGSSETNAGNGGSDAINAAFSAWNGDLSSNVNYALTSTNANPNGITDGLDGFNNVVFEKSVGTPFSCVSGGLLGLGGISNVSGTHPFNLVTFYTTSEGDVSMNQGVGVCIGSGLSVADFNSAVTHEIGHTLGIRHADKGRSSDALGNQQLCTSFSTYDCASSAIMTASVTHGLSGLSTWDQHAVETLYASSAPPAVTGVGAIATTSTNVQVSWTGSCATECHIYRSSDHLTYTRVDVGFVTTSPFNNTVSSTPTAYLYKVRAFNGTESADSNVDLATTVIYMNTITAPSSIIKAVDINEMRTAVDAVRSLYGIGAGFYTYGTGSPVRIAAGTLVHALDINELRTNLNTAINGLFGTTPAYTNTIAAGSSIVKAIDFNEIRNVMR